MNVLDYFYTYEYSAVFAILSRSYYYYEDINMVADAYTPVIVMVWRSLTSSKAKQLDHLNTLQIINWSPTTKIRIITVVALLLLSSH